VDDGAAVEGDEHVFRCGAGGGDVQFTAAQLSGYNQMRLGSLSTTSLTAITNNFIQGTQFY